MPVEEGLSAGELLALYEAAEDVGYHTALCGEVAGAEVLSLMGMAAARTSRIRLGSGILATYTRPAPLAAMGFATLASAAPGRIVAGFGASSPIIVGRWHGIPFNKPFTTTREYLELFGRVMAGGKISYAGEELTCDGFRLQMQPPSPVPVWLGAMGDRMLALAGEVADGAFLAWCPPGEVAAKRQIIHQAARAAGRDPQAVETGLLVLGLRRRPPRRGARADAPVVAGVRHGADASALLRGLLPLPGRGRAGVGRRATGAGRSVTSTTAWWTPSAPWVPRPCAAASPSTRPLGSTPRSCCPRAPSSAMRDGSMQTVLRCAP